MAILFTLPFTSCQGVFDKNLLRFATAVKGLWKGKSRKRGKEGWSWDRLHLMVRSLDEHPFGPTVSCPSLCVSVCNWQSGWTPTGFSFFPSFPCLHIQPSPILSSLFHFTISYRNLSLPSASSIYVVYTSRDQRKREREQTDPRSTNNHRDRRGFIKNYSPVWYFERKKFMWDASLSGGSRTEDRCKTHARRADKRRGKTFYSLTRVSHNVCCVFLMISDADPVTTYHSVIVCMGSQESRESRLMTRCRCHSFYPSNISPVSLICATGILIPQDTDRHSCWIQKQWNNDQSGAVNWFFFLLIAIKGILYPRYNTWDRVTIILCQRKFHVIKKQMYSRVDSLPWLLLMSHLFPLSFSHVTYAIMK